MAKIKQGQILKYLIKERRYKVEDFATMMGYKARESLTRLFQAEILRGDIVLKAATLLGVSQSEIVGHHNGTQKNGGEVKTDSSCEVEKARLRVELDEARKTIRDLSAALRALSEKN